MKVSSELAAFQQRLGYSFKDPELLVRALTHGSISSVTRPDNQRLEFLGDRVLGLVISEKLLSNDPNAPEGTLAPRYNALVRKEACADVARQIELGEVLKLGRSEMKTGGRRKLALLGDAMEAVIAAVYLDAGLDAARTMIITLWGERIDGVDEDARDPKTALQEWAQARKMPPPKYIETSREGPDHAPMFTIKAELADGKNSQAQANSKRAAEQAAARTLLMQLENTK